jgi:uroporphyrinogen-III synthase
VGVREGPALRIVVTRPAGQEHELVARLAAAGHAVTSCPLIEIAALGDEPIVVSSYDWVIVTSANAARELRRRMVGTPARVAAIGQATAAAFGPVDLVPAMATQEGLLAELPRPAGRVLFAGAAGARRLLADELDADVVVLYETRALSPTAIPESDAVLVASPSAATSLAAVAPGSTVVSIGPETSSVARAAGLHVVAQAATHDVDGLVDAVALLALGTIGIDPGPSGA